MKVAYYRKYEMAIQKRISCIVQRMISCTLMYSTLISR